VREKGRWRWWLGHVSLTDWALGFGTLTYRISQKRMIEKNKPVSFVGSAIRRPRGDGICGDKAKPGLCHLSRTLRDKSRTPAVYRTKVAGLGVTQEGMLMRLLLASD